MKKAISLLSLLVIPCATMIAQENTVSAMVTDRPDATESPSIVPVGSLQVETGAFTTTFEENNFKERVWGYNTTLLRYGILDNLELRVGWNFEETQVSINDNQLDDVLSGFSPLLFGAKIAIAQEQDWKPQVALLGHLYLPFTAGEDFKPESTQADFRFAFNHTLSDRSGIAYNIGGQWTDDNPRIAYIYTLSYGYAITGRLGAYAEVYGDLPEDTRGNHLWDVGLTYAVAALVQLDATVGRSFTEGQDLLISAGVSFRIDKK